VLRAGPRTPPEGCCGGGRRRVFQVGLATFTAGSALCSLAPALGWLIALRMLQAIGGAMLNPVAMSFITSTFHGQDRTGLDHRHLGRHVWSVLSLGPLVDSIGWRARST
jgi:MFS family permease